MPDIFDEIAQDNAGGGDIFDEIAPDTFGDIDPFSPDSKNLRRVMENFPNERAQREWDKPTISREEHVKRSTWRELGAGDKLAADLTLSGPETGFKSGVAGLFKGLRILEEHANPTMPQAMAEDFRRIRSAAKENRTLTPADMTTPAEAAQMEAEWRQLQSSVTPEQLQADQDNRTLPGRIARRIEATIPESPQPSNVSRPIAAVGNAAGSLASSMMFAPLGPAGVTEVMFLMELSDAYDSEMARQQDVGEPLNPDKAFLKANLYAPGSAALEYIGGAGRLARRWFGLAAEQEVKELARRGGPAAVLHFFKARATDAAAEGGTEALQRLYQDAIVMGKPNLAAALIEGGSAAGGSLLLGGLSMGARLGGHKANQAFVEARQNQAAQDAITQSGQAAALMQSLPMEGTGEARVMNRAADESFAQPAQSPGRDIFDEVASESQAPQTVPAASDTSVGHKATSTPAAATPAGAEASEQVGQPVVQQKHPVAPPTQADQVRNELLQLPGAEQDLAQQPQQPAAQPYTTEQALADLGSVIADIKAKLEQNQIAPQAPAGQSLPQPNAPQTGILETPGGPGENTLAPALETQPQTPAPPALSTPAKPVTPPVKRKSPFVVRPRPDGVPDILDAIQEAGGMAPLDSAVYGNWRDAFTGPARMLIRKGGRAADKLVDDLSGRHAREGEQAQQAKTFRVEKVDDIIEAVRQAVAVREKLRDTGGGEDAQAERFWTAISKQPTQTGGLVRISADQLQPGDKFRLRGPGHSHEELEVRSVANGVVTLKDGKAFGWQEVPEGTEFWAQKKGLELAAAPEQSGGTDATAATPTRGRPQPGSPGAQPQSNIPGRPGDVGADGARRRLERDLRAFTGDPTIQVALGKDARSVQPGSGRSVDQGVQSLAKLFGVRVDWWHQTAGKANLNRFNGWTNPDGNHILLNVATPQPHLAILGHELIHTLSARNPALYAELIQALRPLYRNLPEYDALKRKIGYQGSLEAIEEEFIADFAASQFNTPAFWERLHDQNPSVFKRTLNRLLSYLDKLIGQLTGQQYQAEQWFSDVTAAREVLAEALAKYAAGKNGGAATGGKMSADDLFGAPESVEEQREREKAEKRKSETLKAKETMRDRAQARLTGSDIDTTKEMFGAEVKQDKAGQGSLFSVDEDGRNTFQMRMFRGDPFNDVKTRSAVGTHWSNSREYAEEYLRPSGVGTQYEGEVMDRIVTFRRPLDLRPIDETTTTAELRKVLQDAGVPMELKISHPTPGMVADKVDTLGKWLDSWGDPNEPLGDTFSVNSSITDLTAESLKKLGKWDGVLFREHGVKDDTTAIVFSDEALSTPLDANAPVAGGAYGIKTLLETQSQRAEAQADKSNVTALRSEEGSALTPNTSPQPAPADKSGSLRNGQSVSDGGKFSMDEDGRRTFTAGNATVTAPGLFSIDAHHGTPHKVDKFSTAKIGTGEGAQVYGWGLYFAENPAVARDYASKLGSRGEYRVDGKPMQANPADPMREALSLVSAYGWDGAKDEITKRIGRVYAMIESGREVADTLRYVGDVNRQVDQLKGKRVEPPAGNTYTVRLNVEPEDLLDWDKPLSQQSEKVRAILTEHDQSPLTAAAMRLVYPEKDGRYAVDYHGATIGRFATYLEAKQAAIKFLTKGGMTGQMLYSYSKGEAENVSKALLASGIRGIRYLDQGSRQTVIPVKTFGGWTWNGRTFNTEAEAKAFGESSATYNYVIFSDEDITITHENGQPVSAGALFSMDQEAPADFDSLQEQITAAEAALKKAIRQHMNPPQGMRKAEALEAKNAAASTLHRLMVRQLKQMTSAQVDAARSPEQTAEMIGQTVDLLNSIQDEISERTARSQEVPADLTKLRQDLQTRLNLLKGWADDQTDEAAQTVPSPRPRTQRDARLVELESATNLESATPTELWDKLKFWLRHLTNPIPELPLTGPRAVKSALFRRGYRLFAVENDHVQKQAADKVNHVLEPLIRLGRHPQDNVALKQYFRLGEALQRAKMDPAKTKSIREKMTALEVRLNRDPFNLFRRVVLYRDLFWRGTYLKTDQGKPITLPMGLTVDEVHAELGKLTAAITTHPDGLAITEALHRHYALTDDLQKSILEHGEIIPESLRNPLYFPHHMIDSWTGRIDRVRATTEEDFRRYLITPQGSGKLIQTDYLKAMYLHTADVLAHNARVDLVKKYWQPYDISEQLKAQHGEDWNKPWNIPPGYTTFAPFKKLPLRMDYILSREVLADKLGVLFNDGDLRQRMGEKGMVLKIKPEDLHAAMVAGEKIVWVLPEDIAAALHGIHQRENERKFPGFGHAIGTPLRKLNSFWKGAKLFAPWNWVRYEYGNLSTDVIDKVLAADPGTAKHLARAAREVWHSDAGEQSPEFKAAQREGVFDTVTAGEAGKLLELPAFKDFLTPGEKNLALVKRILGGPARGSKFREAAFRYAKFLADLERLRAGNHPVWAGAFHGDIAALGEDVDGQRRMLDGEELLYAQAAEISLKTFGDYNSLGVAGQWLRQYAIPFWSWQDVNFRYHANQMRNLADGMMGKVGDVGAARKAALRYAGIRVVSTLIAVGIAKELWNQFGGPAMGLWDDDDDLESKLSEQDRRRGHILLGKDAKGQVLVAYTPSAWSDVAEWIGGQNMKRLFMEYARGQITLDVMIADYAKQLPGDTLNKLAQSGGPLLKAPYEAISGKSTFPDVLDQRTVPQSERGWRLVSTLTDDRVVNTLRAAFDDDFYSQPAGEQLQQIILQVRRRDPEQWAYYEVREDASDWKEAKTGKRFEQGSYDAPEALTLRNFRKSIYRGDVANAERFYGRLIEFGYTAERLDASIRNQHPLADLNQKERTEYINTLTPKQRQELDMAAKYFNKIKALDGRERQLFPKKGQTARPNPALLRRVVEDQSRNK